MNQRQFDIHQNFYLHTDGWGQGQIPDIIKLLVSVQLKAACDLGQIEKNEKLVLENCLDLRNNCGHPGQYKPEEYKALSFLEDLLTILFDK